MDTQLPQSSAPVIHSYAGFWKRFVAWIIDKILLGILFIVLLLPSAGIIGLGALDFDEISDAPLGFLLALAGAYLITAVIYFVLHWLYYALMESTRGATVGKLVLGIQVVDMTGGRISFGRASGRHFSKLISGLTLGVGYIIAGFTQQKQALHDIISGCLVINK
jgi:uncharacterized RDD family membrane protein YckC